MTKLIRTLLAFLMLVGAGTRAQTIVHSDENLASDRPEAWAMNYFAASTLMTGFGETPPLPPWRAKLTFDLGHVPRLSNAQEKVGFNGVKSEDLNKSPLFGRIRLMLGLPSGWVAELGYTPPLSLNGAQPRDLVAAAIGHRLFEYDLFTLSMRAFGQHGRAHGDITCPAKLVGVVDIQQNPYGCQARSDDQLTLDYYGVELTSAWSPRPWQLHASLGTVRADLAVQVDALTFNLHDQSLLVARSTLPFATAGISRDLDAHWNTGVEILYVPLNVRRQFNATRERDPFTSLRLQVVYRFD